MAVEEARTVFNLLMTTGQGRLLKHHYFGLPIKSLAIFMAFADLVINVFPAMLVSVNFRIILFAVTLGIRVPALYVVIVPKIKQLNMYRGVLLITIAVTFVANCMQIVVNFTSTNCQKIPIRNFFAVSGVICPLELIVFMTISAYISFLADQYPPNGPADPDVTKTQSTEKDKMKEEMNNSAASENLNVSITDPNAPLLI